LKEIAAGSGMETVIIRPPLVYGPGVRANFLRLLRLVDRQLPMPLASVNNRRSLVSVWNLCDLVSRTLTHSAAAGQTFMVSDGLDLTTPDLIRRMASAMGRRTRLLPVPEKLLLLAGALLGKKAEVMRLCGSLAVDIRATRDRLDWAPALSVDEGIARTVAWYLNRGPERAK
jgi:UDP-glucose 4-epimerase